MTAKVFFDTNVLVYAAVGTGGDEPKRRRALEDVRIEKDLSGHANLPGTTNVLVYAAVGTGGDEPKRRRALDLIESEDFGTSAQVLQEFYVTVVRKASRPLSAVQAMEWIEQWTAFPCKTVDHQLV